MPAFGGTYSKELSASPSEVVLGPLVMSSVRAVAPKAPIGYSTATGNYREGHYAQQTQFAAILSSSRDSSVPEVRVVSYGSLLHYEVYFAHYTMS